MAKREDFSQELGSSETGSSSGQSGALTQVSTPASTQSAAGAIRVAQANTGDQQPFNLTNATVAATYTSTERGARIELAPGTAIDQVFIKDGNLYLVQTDGSVVVIVDGATNTPTLVVGDGLEILADRLEQALEGAQEGVPTAGPDAGGPDSGGGDFIVDPGVIGGPFDLRDLLPPTALAFELFPREDETEELDEEGDPVLEDDPVGPSILNVGMVIIEEDDLAIQGNDSDTSGGALFTGMATLGVDFGDGGPGSIKFPASITAQEGFTSNGEQITLVLSPNGRILQGFADGTLVFEAVLSNDFDANPFGKITFTLFDNVDHGTPTKDGLDGETANFPNNLNDEELLFVNIAFDVENGDGLTASGVVQVKIQDDIPEIMVPNQEKCVHIELQKGVYIERTDDEPQEPEGPSEGEGTFAILNEFDGPNPNDLLYKIPEGIKELHIEITDIMSDAGFENALGYYFADIDGNPLSGFLMEDNVKSDDEEEAWINLEDIPEGAYMLGFFILPDANDLQDLPEDIAVTFQLVEGKWVAFADGEPIQTAHGHVLFSDRRFNPDGDDFEKMGPNETYEKDSNWEDKVEESDNDFNDVQFNVKVTALVNVEFLLQVDEDDIDNFDPNHPFGDLDGIEGSMGTSPDDGNEDGSFTGDPEGEPEVQSGGPAHAHGNLGIKWGSDDGNMEPSEVEIEGEGDTIVVPGEDDGTEFFEAGAVNTVTDSISFDATDDFTHDFVTGEKVVYTTDDPTDPATFIKGLTPGSYYVIDNLDGTISLAASKADALAGTKIDLEFDATNQGNETQFLHKVGDRSVIFDPDLNGEKGELHDGTLLTSKGQIVMYQLVDDGTKLIGFVDGKFFGEGSPQLASFDGYDGEYGYGDGVFNPGTESGDRLVFEAELSDLNDGEIWFTLYDQIDHPDPGVGNMGAPVEDLVWLKFPFIATDSDGDMVMDVITVDVKDDVPMLTDAKPVMLLVDEDDLDNFDPDHNDDQDGIEGSMGQSPNDGSADGSETGPQGQAIVTASLASLVKVGSDENYEGGATFMFINENDARDYLENLGLSSKGGAISFDFDGNELIGFVNIGGAPGAVSFDPENGDRLVFKLSVETDGDVTFELFDQMDHDPPFDTDPVGFPSGDTPQPGDTETADQNTDLIDNDDPDGSPRDFDVSKIDFGGIIKAVDFDGDAITLEGQFGVTIRDDIPVALQVKLEKGEGLEQYDVNPKDLVFAITPGADVRIMISDLMEDAGFENALGYYFADANGNPISGHILEDNVENTSPDLDVSISGSDIPPNAVMLGFFILPDGDGLQDLPEGVDVTFAKINGRWVAKIDGESIDTAEGHVLFSDRNLNPDIQPDGDFTKGDDFELMGPMDDVTTPDGTKVDLDKDSNWEDTVGKFLHNNSDQDYNDVQFNIMVFSEKMVMATVDENDIRTSLSRGTSPNDEGDGSFTGIPPGAGESFGPAFVTGSLTGLVKIGADEPGKFTFIGESDARDYLEGLGLRSKGGLLSFDFDPTSGGSVIIGFVNAEGPGGVSFDPQNGDRPVFRLTLDHDGDYVFELFDQMDHDPPGDINPDGSGGENVLADENLDLIDFDDVPAGQSPRDFDISAIDFGSIIKVSDFDDDVVILDGQFKIKIRDDVPEVEAKMGHRTLTIDESNGEQDDDDNDNADLIALFSGVSNTGSDGFMDTQYATESGVVGATVTPGADEPVEVEWSLKLDGNNGINSGLETTSGKDIFLFEQDGLIVGRFEAGNGPDPAEDTDVAAFAIHIGEDGTLSIVQYVSLRNPNSNDPDDTVSLPFDKILAQVKVTDFDGDMAVDTVDLGGKIRFDDDGPTARDDEDMVREGEGNMTRGNVIKGTDPDTDPDNIGNQVEDDSGADNPLSIMMIEHDGIIYTLSGNGNSVTASDNSTDHSFNSSTKVLTIGTELGGTLDIDLAGNGAGNYKYTAPDAVDHGQTETRTVIDNFFPTAYNGNDGTDDWANSWTETGDDGSAFRNSQNDDIAIISDQGSNRLRLSDDKRFDRGGDDNDATISRSVDLSGANSANLMFDFRRVLSHESDQVQIQIMKDGDAGFTTLQTLQGPITDANYQQFNMDISAYISSNTTIRFVAGGGMEDSDFVFIDNVKISYEVPAIPSEEFIYTVKDADGDNDAATLTIEIKDSGPIAKDDKDMTVEGDMTTGNVISGIDEDANPLNQGMLQEDMLNGDTPHSVMKVVFEGQEYDIGDAVDGVVTIVADHGTLEFRLVDGGGGNAGDYKYTANEVDHVNEQVMLFVNGSDEIDAPSYIDVQGFSRTGQLANLELDDNTGIGIDSNNDGGVGGRFDEINFVEGNQNRPDTSETLVVKLTDWYSATSAEVDLAAFFSSENGVGNEKGQVELFSHGVSLGVVEFTASDVSGDHTFTINGFGAFDELRFTALEGTDDAGGGDSSDYYVKKITFDVQEPVKDIFTYTLKDSDGSTSDADLIIKVKENPNQEPMIIGTPQNSQVDEDTLQDANADNNRPGEQDPTGTNMGEIVVDFKAGNEVPVSDLEGSFAFKTDGLDGQLTTPDGTPITFAIVNGELVGSAGGNPVITISLDSAIQNGTEVTYKYTVNLEGPIEHTSGDDTEAPLSLTNIGFSVTDANQGDMVMGTFNVAIFDDIPVAVLSQDNVMTLDVDESVGTEGSTQDEGGAPNNDENTIVDPFNVGPLIGFGQASGLSFVGTLGFGADGPSGGSAAGATVYALTDGSGAAFAGVDSGLDDTATGDSIFLFSDTLNGMDVIVGRAGNGQDATANPIVLVVYTDPTDGDVTLAQYRAIVHDDNASLNNDHDENNDAVDGSPSVLQTLDAADINIQVTVTDGDGDVAVDRIEIGDQITFDDDGPLVKDNKVEVAEGPVPSNDIILVLDNSGSMNDDIGGGQSRFQLLQNAVETLLNTANVNSVFIVAFNADGSHVAGPVDGWFSDVPSAIAAINALIADGATDYDAALRVLEDNITDPPAGGDQKVLYFLSDGEPNQSDGTGSDGIVGSEITDYENFLATENIEQAFAFGIGAGSSTSTLEPLAFPNGDPDNPQIVDDDGDLAAVLVGTLPSVISGNVITDDNGDGVDMPGSDGFGGIVSITVQTGADPDVFVLFTFDPDANGGTGGITRDDGGSATVGTSFTETTAFGGVFTFHFADNGPNSAGDYTYSAGAVDQDVWDKFDYTIIDGDGDGSTATLTIDVINSFEQVEEGIVGIVEEEHLDENEANHQSTGNEDTMGDMDADTDNDFDQTQNDVQGDLSGLVSDPAATFAVVDVVAANGNNPVDVFLMDGVTQLTSRGDDVQITNVTGTQIFATAGQLQRPIFTLFVDSTGAFNFILLDQIDHHDFNLADDIEGSVQILLNGMVEATSNGNTIALENIKIKVIDDIPIIGADGVGEASVQLADDGTGMGMANIDFKVGADEPGVADLSGNTAPDGLTSEGEAVMYFVDPNNPDVLIAHTGDPNTPADVVFTLTVDLTTNKYTIDFDRSIDGTTEQMFVVGGSSFGSGPQDFQTLTTGSGGTGEDITIASGWLTNGGGFSRNDWFNSDDTTGIVHDDINGSVAGWGTGNNNFTSGEFMRFDFGTVDDFDGGGGAYVPPAITLPETNVANFAFPFFDNGDQVSYVAHYSDGSRENVQLNLTGPNDTLTITAPDGFFIDDVEFYVDSAGGSAKIQLVSTEVVVTGTEVGLAFNAKLADADGDSLDIVLPVSVSGTEVPPETGASAQKATITLSTSSGSGVDGISGDEFEDGDVIQTSDGVTASILFNEDSFSGSADIDGFHHFTSSGNILGQAFTPGDMLLSTTGTESLPGAANFADEDVIFWDGETSQASVLFDGSANGLGNSGQDVDAVSVNPANGNLIISLEDNQNNVDGDSANDFENGDLIQFDGTNYVSTPFFDEDTGFGSGGFTSGGFFGENIDAVHVLGSDEIIFSTTSDATIGGLSFEPDDLVYLDGGSATRILVGNDFFDSNNENIDAVDPTQEALDALMANVVTHADITATRSVEVNVSNGQMVFTFIAAALTSEFISALSFSVPANAAIDPEQITVTLASGETVDVEVQVSEGEDGDTVTLILPDGTVTEGTSLHVTMATEDGDGEDTGVFAESGSVRFAATFDDDETIDGNIEVGEDGTGSGTASTELLVGQTIQGTDGNDILVGGSGNDILIGGAGDDILIGGAGDDILDGGAGENTLTGGEGADTFVLADLDIADIITDYSYEEGDMVDLSALLDGASESTNVADNLENFVRVTAEGDEASLEVDVAGGGDAFTKIATLQGIGAGDVVKVILDDGSDGGTSGDITV